MLSVAPDVLLVELRLSSAALWTWMRRGILMNSFYNAI